MNHYLDTVYERLGRLNSISFSVGPQLHEIQEMPRWLRDKRELVRLVSSVTQSSHTEGVTGKLSKQDVVIDT